MPDESKRGPWKTMSYDCQTPGGREAFSRAWPLIEPNDIVADLWTVPAYLRMCAPWLEPAEVMRLQRPDPQAWTESDLRGAPGV